MDQKRQRPQTVTTRNATFQYWQTLLGNRTKRNRAGEMLVQGVRPITLALEPAVDVRAVLVTRTSERSGWARNAITRAENAGAHTFDVAPELMQELGEKQDDPPELLLVIGIPLDDLARLPAPGDALLVALDRPSSPGNIGSSVRSVDAFGGHGVIVTGHAADPYDPKALRASTGSTLVTPIVRVPSASAVLSWVEQSRAAGAELQVVGTDEKGTRDVWDIDLTRPTLIVTGNEHSGMSAAWRDSCDVLARIPIGGHASSLNAANATSVLLYEAARQRAR
ncbi:TrmH family RNA methyltransferase [Paramicrobacterium agarici]|uniref:TrmH family RNA methyltransferase n=1 Tax=Paramicrobacterium agarici TaxID=630514 RepID=UPI00114D95B5|nr:TrmH family RNA methyltransferase [Microbacterium agarici]TQO23347.1 TrmH family RNA methyltransferase [Microbacterium agarici]